MNYYDEFCCDDIIQISDGELVDTCGGETYEDSHACPTCERVWTVTHGFKTHGTYQSEEIYKDDCEFNEILAEAKRIKDNENEC